VTRRIRVLVVDDSAFARKVLREVLTQSPNIDVVGTARDGLEALEKIAELAPDVLTLDLVMPNLDGIGVLRALPRSAPRVVVVSMSDAESEIAVEALAAGAFDLVHKPTALATDKLYELASELIAKVTLAAAARAPSIRPLPAVGASLRRDPCRDVVVVGTSTGGPQALTRLLTSLPADFPVPIAIVLHIPIGYTQAVAERLDRGSRITVREAFEGLELRPELCVIAKAGSHLRIERLGDRLFCRLDSRPTASWHTPSVDALFTSAAAACGARTLGVVLTGMGDDGLLGARVIHDAGGVILTESESSSVIYGMPRCVEEANLGTAQADIDDMGALIASWL
jgi:two-component system chemotaxis response regulator CheB